MPQVRHSVCPLDCPDACSVLVEIEGERAVRLRGNPDHPITQGFLCAKVTRYLERQYSPERLLYPQRRIGVKGEGRFERISWDQALDEIAGTLRQLSDSAGPESILPYSYGGTMGLLNGSGMDRRFFHRLGASRLDRTICAAAGAAGLMQALGARYGTEPEQFRHSKLIIAWGANICATNIHLWPFIVEARRQGAKFYVIDPHRSETAALADKHFAVYPGSDAALALGMLHVILAERLFDASYIAEYTEGFEELRGVAAGYPPAEVERWTGIPAADIAALAREYATTRPAAIRVNYGIQRSERGAMAVRAVSLLPVVTGSWKDQGGGLQLSTSQAFQLNRAALEREDLQLASPLRRPARMLNMSRLGQILNSQQDPPVRAMVCYNANPAAVAPDQHAVLRGLRRDDLFTVVLEHFQTDTADYADILLPATTFLEHTDLYYAYGHLYLQLARPALQPPGEARSNQEIFRALAPRMGFTESCFEDSDDEMIRQTLASGHRFLDGITLERLDREHSVRLNVAAEGEPFLPFAKGGFGTDSGKCEFQASTLAYEPPVESRLGDPALSHEYPLEMITPKSKHLLNSTFTGARDGEPPEIVMHAADAESRGLATGDPVRVYNSRGSCVFRLRIEESVRPGLVRGPSVRWNKRSPGRHNVNVLTPDRLTDSGGGPCFYNCLVQAEKAGD